MLSKWFKCFSRRRQTEDSSSVKRRSQSGSSARCSQTASETEGDRLEYRCPLCRRPYVEPRVLPCLHTFCTPCLQRLKPSDDSGSIEDGSDVSINDKTEVCGSRSGSGSGSAGSGYESEPRDSSSNGSWDSKRKADKHKGKRHYVQYSEKISVRSTLTLPCPLCGAECPLGHGGIFAYPIHFLLQHRMLVEALHRDPSRLLCDLCAEDVPALTRCTTCLISLCGGCGAVHAKQNGGIINGGNSNTSPTIRHSLLSLTEAAKRGTLTLRRQPLCQSHPDNELKLFCSTCCQVICCDCCLISHDGHSYEPAARAAENYIGAIKEAVSRVKPVVKQTTSALEKIQNIGKRIQIKSDVVQEDVEQFIDSYIRVVKEHRQTLELQVFKARDIKMQALANQRMELEKRAESVKDAIKFAEDILSEGTDVEVLSFVGPLLRRLDWCTDMEGIIESRVSENLELIKDQKAGQYGDYTVYGVVSTQCVEPSLCAINSEGFRGVRVHRPHELILETRDTSGQPLCGGGAKVWGALRRPGARPRSISVKDMRDGTYALSFIPDVVGTFQLAVLVNGKPIKNSPFKLVSREARPHTGKYHCCSFCSSGGNRSASCACGGAGRMGAGYQGCGHGHPGHPGTRHWSCCGATDQNAECTQTGTYQFSL